MAYSGIDSSVESLTMIGKSTATFVPFRASLTIGSSVPFKDPMQSRIRGIAGCACELDEQASRISSVTDGFR